MASALVLIALTLAETPTLAASGTIVPAQSVGAVEQAIDAGLSLTRLPASLTPTLQQLATNHLGYEGAITYITASCDPYDHLTEASNPQPCWFGATKATDPVMVVFGDSFNGNWMPALSEAGKVLGFRVANFEFQGCFTAFTPANTSPGFNQNEVAGCNSWHTTMPPAVRKLHPTVIVAASGTQVWRTTQAAWVQGMQLAFHELNPKGTATQILMGTGIDMPYPAPECLAANPSNVQACTYHYAADSYTQANFNRDAVVAASVKHVHLIPTYELVCQHSACPMIVRHLIVYGDYDHLTVAYSTYLSSVILAALRSILHR